MADSMIQHIFVCCVLLTRVVFGDDDHSASAVTYDSDTFAAGVKGNVNFVMFYAPWCGHCKNLAPTWDELAKLYNKEASPVVIAKVDCTVHTGLCADHEVVGFPTLKLFDAEGESHKRYTGKRDLESLKAFVQEHLNGEPPQVEENAKKPEVPEPKSNLVILTDTNFKELVEKGSFFIKFYAPWCGHCQKLAPTWDDLAETFNHNDKVNIAKIDCTQSKDICKHFDIGGYPTLLWLKNGEKTDEYEGPRNHEALKNYVSDRLAAEVGELPGQEQERVPETGSDTERVPETDQGSVNSVIELTDDNFKSIISSGLHFVKFYAPWCGHCKRLAPTWEDLGKEIHSHQVAIGKVDCTLNKATCDENQVRGYPTLKLFRNGEFIKDYKGARTLEDLHEFAKKSLEEGHDEL